MPTSRDEVVGDVRVGGRSEGRADVVAVLASFLPPARARREAARLHADDALEQAVSLLRGRYGASAADLAVALDSAGVGVVAVARLVDADPVTVNRWIDEADGTGHP